VNLPFPFLAALFMVAGIWFRYTYSSNFEYLLIVYFGIPVILLLLSGAMGVASKRAIDYVPGEWQQQKLWASFPEYEQMVRQHEKAYGSLYAHPAEGCTCFILVPVALALGGLGMIYQLYGQPLFSTVIDSAFLITIQYGIVSVLGFLVGYRIPKIDPKTFFKPPQFGDVDKFTRELANVPGVKAGMSVDLGQRGEAHIILGAECKAYVDGLPESVMIKVQISRSGFVYPYLVGTIYKGNAFEKRSEELRLRTKYPALLEYSMDKDVAVIVARFDIPKRTNEVPNISKGDFRILAAVLAEKLRQSLHPQ